MVGRVHKPVGRGVCSMGGSRRGRSPPRMSTWRRCDRSWGGADHRTLSAGALMGAFAGAARSPTRMATRPHRHRSWLFAKPGPSHQKTCHRRKVPQKLRWFPSGGRWSIGDHAADLWSGFKVGKGARESWRPGLARKICGGGVGCEPYGSFAPLIIAGPVATSGEVRTLVVLARIPDELAVATVEARTCD
jgi:hypothetical protein